jgi:hypothetical protein
VSSYPVVSLLLFSDRISSGACVCAANSAQLVLDSCSISSGSGAGVFVCGKATACITATAAANMVSFLTMHMHCLFVQPMCHV